MRTFAIVARKGGSGKTTVAVHLAIAAHLAGRSTRILDTDPQGSATEVCTVRSDPRLQCRATRPSELLRAKLDARASGVDALLIDTAAGTEEGMSTALVLADLALLVIRPTYLDLTAAVHTVEVLKKLNKPTLAVLNQAPVAREGIEPPAVRQAKEVLRLMRLPMLPVILRGRASYQSTLAHGRSAIEVAPDSSAARDLARLWSYVEQFVFSDATAPPRMAAA